MTDEELAGDLALGAGRLLLELRGQASLDGAALGKAGDRIANAFILTALRERRPADSILSEESPDDLDRLAARRVWIIDPLDGTREYGEGRDDWAVHVALAIDGRPSVGALAIPALGRLLRSDQCPPPSPCPRSSPIMLVSRTRPPEQAAALAAHIGAQIAPMGSAGAKAASVIVGDADLYFHSGGQHEWDNCAPAAVAIGAGLHATRIDGSPLAYNRPDTLVPDIVIAGAEFAPRVTAFFKSSPAFKDKDED